MIKKIKAVLTFVCIAFVLFFTVLVWAHKDVITVQLAQFSAQQIAQEKQAAEQAEKQAKQKAIIRRFYACQTDEDCIIVDKDPCGCAAGPQGVVAINIDYINNFAAQEGGLITKACPEEVSTEKECSPDARAVCQARTCKIVY